MTAKAEQFFFRGTGWPKHPHFNANLSPTSSWGEGSVPFTMGCVMGWSPSPHGALSQLVATRTPSPGHCLAAGMGSLHTHRLRLPTHLRGRSSRRKWAQVRTTAPTTEMGEFSHWGIAPPEDLRFSLHTYRCTEIYVHTASTPPLPSVFTCFHSSSPFHSERKHAAGMAGTPPPSLAGHP